MRNYRNQNQILENKIIYLESKRHESLKVLSIQLETTYQELRPSRLLTRALMDIKEAPEIKGNLFESLISLSGGYLSKKLFVGKSKSIIKQVLGFTIQYFTMKIISKNIKQ